MYRPGGCSVVMACSTSNCAADVIVFSFLADIARLKHHGGSECGQC